MFFYDEYDDADDLYLCGYYDGYYDLPTDRSISWSEDYWYGIHDGDNDWYDGAPYGGYGS